MTSPECDSHGAMERSQQNNHPQSPVRLLGRSGDCYFWRSRGGSEVDFVLYGEDHFHAVEVKNAKQIHPKILKSLKTFLSDYLEASAMLLYGGTEKLMVDGILCSPVEDFLLQLKPNH